MPVQPRSSSDAPLVAAPQDIGGTIPKLLDMGDYPDGYDLAGEQCVFVVCSTHGDGVPPAEARDFGERCVAF